MDIMPQMPSMDLYRTGTLFNAPINAPSVPLRRAPSSCFWMQACPPLQCCGIYLAWLGRPAMRPFDMGTGVVWGAGWIWGDLRCRHTGAALMHVNRTIVNHYIEWGYMVVLMNPISRIVPAFLHSRCTRSLSRTYIYIMPQIFPSRYIKPHTLCPAPSTKKQSLLLKPAGEAH